MKEWQRNILMIIGALAVAPAALLYFSLLDRLVSYLRMP